MKRVEIKDDDEDLFNIPFHLLVYIYYRENKKQIHRMLKQQSHGFWIQFVTSFRSFMSKNDFIEPDEQEVLEEAFIDMLKILTGEHSVAEFASLFESLHKFHSLLDAYKRHPFFPSYISRITEISGFEKRLETLSVYSRYVCALVILYQRWKHAPRIRGRTLPAKWIPPDHWSQQNIDGLRPYESYLHSRWGNTLFRILHVDDSKMKLFKEDDHSSNTSSNSHQNSLSNTGQRTQRRKNRKKHGKNRRKHSSVSNDYTDYGKKRCNEHSDEPHVEDRSSCVEHNFKKGKNPARCSEDQNNNNEIRNDCERSNKSVQTGAFGIENEVAGSSQPLKRSGEFKERKTEANSFMYDKLFDFSSREEEEEEEVEVVSKETEEALSSQSIREKNEVQKKTKENCDTFKYDRLFNFSRKVTTEAVRSATSSGENVIGMPRSETNKTAGVVNARKKNAGTDNISSTSTQHPSKILGSVPKNDKQEGTTYEKENKNVSFPIDKKPPANGNGRSNSADINSFKYDRLFSFSTKKAEQKKQNMSSPANKKVASDSHKTDNVTDSFRYDRIFSFSTETDKLKNEPPPNDKTEKTKTDFFKYDRLFSFTTTKDHKSKENVHSPSDKDMSNDTSKKNRTVETDSFRYDRLFNFSTKNGNVSNGTFADGDEKNLSSAKNNTNENYFFEDVYFSSSSEEDDDFDENFSESESETSADPFSRFYRDIYDKHTYMSDKEKRRQPVRKFLMQKCSNCNVLEKFPGMYKECKKCIKESVWIPKLYCGAHCQRVHWKKHCRDHTYW